MTTPPLFIADRWQAHELLEADVPVLQGFFDANPLYFRSVNGQDAQPGEARSEFDDLPPPEMTYSRKWVLKIVDETGAYAAMAFLLADFLAPRVWHIGLYIVETALHGSGAARTIYQALEDWIAQAGGEYIRLGAVVGYANAERFWTGRGYREVRRRLDVPSGLRRNDLHVYVKPLAGGTLSDYLARVARDNPGAT